MESLPRQKMCLSTEIQSIHHVKNVIIYRNTDQTTYHVKNVLTHKANYRSEHAQCPYRLKEHTSAMLELFLSSSSSLSPPPPPPPPHRFTSLDTDGIKAIMVAFSISMYITCVVYILVQRFEPQGRRFTQFPLLSL